MTAPDPQKSYATPGKKPAGRKKRVEMPKPGIVPGTLGFQPVNAFSIGGMYHQPGTALLSYHDDTPALALKGRELLPLCGKPDEALRLPGRYYNGLADAFYRGMLREVMIETPRPDELLPFFNEVMDYLEKLLTLGYFSQHPDPVSAFVPCFVIAGEGIIFSRFITQLARQLSGLERLDNTLRRRILGRFTRGVLQTKHNTAQIDLSAPISVGEPDRHIRIGGGDAPSRDIIQTVLKAHHFAVDVESRVSNAMERLEFEQAFYRASKAILPLLKADKSLSVSEAKTLERKISDFILALGQRRHAFKATEDRKTLLASLPSAALGKSTLAPSDAALFQSLGHYAMAMGLQDDHLMFQELNRKVLERLKPLST